MIRFLPVIALGLGGGLLVNLIFEAIVDREPIGLKLISLEYRAGRVTQSHEVVGVPLLQAEWSAKLLRPEGAGSRVLCYGSGTGTYRTQAPRDFSLSDWVGDESCPQERVGDVLEVSWSWLNEDGHQEIIGRRLKLERRMFK